MHAIAFGQRLFGKCDKVPGQYHVATLCWHFCYLPLLPLGTHLVLSERMHGMDTTFRGVRIPFSVKSYLLAWSRTLLAFPWLMSVGIVITQFYEKDKDLRAARGFPYAVAIFVAITLLLFAPYFIPGLGRATASRAATLAACAPPPPPRGKIAVYK